MYSSDPIVAYDTLAGSFPSQKKVKQNESFTNSEKCAIEKQK